MKERKKKRYVFKVIVKFLANMKCDNCKKENQWLEIIGNNFICHKCINKSKIMGLILRTHADTFKYIIKKMNIKDYKSLMELKRGDIEQVVDLKKYGIFLKTTNVVNIE